MAATSEWCTSLAALQSHPACSRLLPRAARNLRSGCRFHPVSSAFTPKLYRKFVASRDGPRCWHVLRRVHACLQYSYNPHCVITSLLRISLLARILHRARAPSSFTTKRRRRREEEGVRESGKGSADSGVAGMRVQKRAVTPTPTGCGLQPHPISPIILELLRHLRNLILVKPKLSCVRFCSTSLHLRHEDVEQNLTHDNFRDFKWLVPMCNDNSILLVIGPSARALL
eukprot:6190585-Pleurochrysis_carterae.AAC.1